MKKRIAPLLVIVALFGAACGGDDDPAVDAGDDTETTVADQSTTAPGAELDTVSEGKLTVCSDIPYAPFEYEEAGELTGIDIDLMELIAEKIGLEAEFKDTDFDGIFAALAAGSCDVIASSVSITEERKQVNDFTQGYFEINQSLLVRADDAATLKDLASLKGKTIGVQSETTGAKFAETKKGEGGYSIKSFTGADEMFTALKAKQIDGIIQDLPINAYHATTTGETEVTIAFTEAAKEEYGFVVPKDKVALREAIDDALTTLRDERTYDRILQQYLGETP